MISTCNNNFWINFDLNSNVPIIRILFLCITDMKLADILSEKTVYTWGDQDKNAARKVIWISSYLVGVLDSVTMKALTVRLFSLASQDTNANVHFHNSRL